MNLIAHRRNTIEDLVATPPTYGVEVDVRSQGERLVLHHDPFVEGQEVSAWLDHYRHGTLILNVKEEGLEDRLLQLMSERNIDDFFFLDQSFPLLLRTAKRGEARCAVRVSEFESINTPLSLAGLIEWVWIDCFTRFPLSRDEFARLRSVGFKLCVVSPELQQRSGQQEIPSLKNLFVQWDQFPDAVCTKWPERWST